MARAIFDPVPERTPAAQGGKALMNLDWLDFFRRLGMRREHRSGIYVLRLGDQALGWSNATPTAGDWQAGDVLFDPTPTVGSPYLRVCTVGGSPGTWVAGANL